MRFATRPMPSNSLDFCTIVCLNGTSSHCADSFPAAEENRKILNVLYETVIQCYIWIFCATQFCLLLLILNLKSFLFSSATGVTCCGGMRMFGSDRICLRELLLFLFWSNTASGKNYLHWRHNDRSPMDEIYIWPQKKIVLGEVGHCGAWHVQVPLV